MLTSGQVLIIISRYFIRFSMLKDKLGSTITAIPGRIMGFDVCIIDRDSANDVRRRKVWKNIGNVGENWNNMDDAGSIALANPKADIRIISPIGNMANFGTYKISPNAASDVRDVVFAIKNTGLQDLVISSIGATGLGFSVAPLSRSTCKTNDTIQLHLKFTSAIEGVSLEIYRLIAILIATIIFIFRAKLLLLKELVLKAEMFRANGLRQITLFC